MTPSELNALEERLFVRVLEQLELSIRRIPHTNLMHNFLSDVAYGLNCAIRERTA
jgi:hypothetical protein